MANASARVKTGRRVAVHLGGAWACVCLLCGTVAVLGCPGRRRVANFGCVNANKALWLALAYRL